jgi:tRNA pseudouridine38-40 synthase
MRIALGIEYDGSHYCGWQSQCGVDTVQDSLQAALSEIAASLIVVSAAGRTDTGVHGIEQVVHFDTHVVRPLQAWVRGVNAVLPRSIVVRWAHPVSAEFHARFSAEGRSYRYFLMNRATRTALHAGKVGWYHLPLDVELMRQAAQYLLGTHDFSALRAAECQAKSPIKTMRSLDIQREGDMLVFDVSADAFLHHMVRNIVGCLVYVGKGKHPPEWMGDVLVGRNRRLAAPTFAPDGLYLRHIQYDARWGLPQLETYRKNSK